MSCNLARELVGERIANLRTLLGLSAEDPAAGRLVLKPA